MTLFILRGERCKTRWRRAMPPPSDGRERLRDMVVLSVLCSPSFAYVFIFLLRAYEDAPNGNGVIEEILHFRISTTSETQNWKTHIFQMILNNHAKKKVVKKQYVCPNLKCLILYIQFPLQTLCRCDSTLCVWGHHWNANWSLAMGKGWTAKLGTQVFLCK